jgi:hypothetical protein
MDVYLSRNLSHLHHPEQYVALRSVVVVLLVVQLFNASSDYQFRTLRARKQSCVQHRSLCLFGTDFKNCVFLGMKTEAFF